jgi:hypothetical protein
MSDNDNNVEVHERLARIEAILEAIKDDLQDQKECDEKQDVKLDQILSNDKDKLQRITKTEEKVKNVRATLWIFAVPLAGVLIKVVSGLF